MRNKKRNSKHWSDTKPYLHIGIAPNQKDKTKWIEKYVKSDSKIAQHSFLPLIRRVSVEKRNRKQYIDNTPVSRLHSLKKRELCYASHLDAIIYRYYSSQILQPQYESILRENISLNKSIVAYREIPRYDNRPQLGNRSNIDIANEVFSYIKNQKASELFVGIYDIANFFNSLDHRLLKKIWIDICNFPNSLPTDHYNLFKNICYYSYINETKIFERCKDSIICRKSKNDRTEVNRKVSKRNHLRDALAIAYCQPSFIKCLRQENLIIANKLDANKTPRNCGIPQGLPISATLANMYMLPFDKILSAIVSGAGGIYRRYSDDIIIVCPNNRSKLIKKVLLEQIAMIKLKIQEKKANEFILTKTGEKYVCKRTVYPYKTKMEYLGFEFDGNRILLKSSSISKFYIKMHRGVHVGKYFARNIKSEELKNKLFIGRLFDRYSTYGAKPKARYIESNLNGRTSVRFTRKTWGNFITYAYKASKIMQEPAIKRQLRRHLPILRKQIIGWRNSQI